MKFEFGKNKQQHQCIIYCMHCRSLLSENSGRISIRDSNAECMQIEPRHCCVVSGVCDCVQTVVSWLQWCKVIVQQFIPFQCMRLDVMPWRRRLTRLSCGISTHSSANASSLSKKTCQLLRCVSTVAVLFINILALRTAHNIAYLVSPIVWKDHLQVQDVGLSSISFRSLDFLALGKGVGLYVGWLICEYIQYIINIPLDEPVVNCCEHVFKNSLCWLIM